MIGDWLLRVPLVAMYVVTAISMYGMLELGFLLGRAVQKRWPDGSESSVGVMVGAGLATLGFLLAFVTGIAVGNFNERRHLVIEEANAISTTYLRAGILQEPSREEARQLLREYAELRLRALDRSQTASAILRSEAIHDELWLAAEAIGLEQPTPTVALYLASLNEVIDLHTERLSAELGYRVPATVLLGLFLVALLTLFLVGVYDGYRERHNRVALIVTVLIISLVFMLIVDLDRSNLGLIQVPQKALLDLQQSLLDAP